MEQNNLSVLSYRVKLSGAKNVELRCQSVQIPGMTLGTPDVATPFLVMQEPGTITYGGPLSLSFLVGENLTDYLEIFNWMNGLGQPDGFDQTYERKFTDASVLILNSTYKPIINVRFVNIFPISITPIDFTSTTTDIQYITAQVSFNFDRYYYDTI
jgi:hypothetical protein